MSSLKRILSFVPPILLFVFPAFAQIQGKLVQLPGTSSYRVSIIPTMDIAPPFSSTSSAQMTLRVSSGKLNLTNFQSLTGNWEMQSQYVAPNEAPGYDYFRFFLVNPLLNISYVNGTEIPMFKFDNNEPCTAIEIVDNATDPFVSNNTLMVNAENYFSVIMFGPAVNAYSGNTSENSAACPSLGLDISAAANPLLCNGDKANLTVKALEGVEPYTVVYKNTSTGATANAVISTFEGVAWFNNVPAGNYLFTITDSKDSTGQVNYQISQPAPLKVKLLPLSASCEDSYNGAIEIESINGLSINSINISDYSIHWGADPSNTSTLIDSLVSGTYSVTVTDQNGCTTSASTFVGFDFDFFFYEIIKPISCFGENNGIIDVITVAPGGPSDYQYHWSPNANTALDQSVAWMLGPGEYHITVTLDNGACSRSHVVTLEEPEEISIEYTTTEPECYGDEAYLNVQSVGNTQGVYSLEVKGEHTQLTDLDFEVKPGIPLQLVVKDGEGCKITENLIIPDKQEMFVDLGEDKSIKYGESVYIDADVYPLTGVEMEWSPAEWLDCTDCPDPTASPLDNQNYRFRLTDIISGCTVEDDINISVRKSRDIYIPNAFSPNKNGINDTFHPYGGFEIVQIRSLMVFDRWGGLVYSNEDGFKLDDDEAGWDGSTNGKTLDPGTYIYTMNVEFIDGEIILYSGEINLIN